MHFRLAGAVALSLALFAACGNDDGGGAGTTTAPGTQGGTLAFSQPYTNSPTRTAIVRFASERATELGFNLLLDEANQDVARQVAAIETWISSGVDAITVFPLDGAATVRLAQQALEAGIPWISYGAPSDPQSASVIFENPDGARRLAEAAAAWINERGGTAKVAILTFDPSPLAQERSNLYKEVLAALAPNAEIVAEQDGGVSVEGGLAATETILQRHPDLNVVLGILDDQTIGAYQAFINAGVAKDSADVFLGGMDSPQQALELVKQCGIYRSTAALDLEALGIAVVDAMVAAAGGAPVDKAIPYEIVACKDTAALDRLLSQYTR
jgi:ABC-type sugar transport system substrate-binding protein